MTMPNSTVQREHDKFVEDAGGNTAVRTQLTVQDIHIGQVEIKDATTATFANVSTMGATNALHIGVFDSSGNQIDNFGGGVNVGVDTKQVTVSTAGTAVALALGNTKKFTIRADDSNTGNVAVGDSTVTMLTGYVLTPGESTNPIESDDATAAMYVDAATDGDGVSVIYEY